MKRITRTLKADVPITSLSVRGPVEFQEALNKAVVRGVVLAERIGTSETPPRTFGIALLLDGPGLCPEDVIALPDMVVDMLCGMFGEVEIKGILLMDALREAMTPEPEGGETDQPLH